MKYFTTLSLLLVIFVTYTTQQCPGAPRPPSCSGPFNPGFRRPGCTPRLLWYFSSRSRTCVPLPYLGCGGNNNRHCTRASCLQRCRR